MISKMAHILRNQIIQVVSLVAFDYGFIVGRGVDHELVLDHLVDRLGARWPDSIVCEQLIQEVQ